MIDGREVIAVIPARAGSKTIPQKNIMPLNGKPLIYWTIATAKSSKYIDRVIVSTDGDDIAALAKSYGAEVYTRPASLAGDQSLAIDALRDLHLTLKNEGSGVDVFVLLEPTSPLRNQKDVDGCIELLVTKCHDSVATFAEASLNPHRAWKVDGATPFPFCDGAIPWLPRQQQPEAWELNGAVYSYYVDRLPKNDISILFGKIGAMIMPRNRSVDIDDYVDIATAEAMMKINHESRG